MLVSIFGNPSEQSGTDASAWNAICQCVLNTVKASA